MIFAHGPASFLASFGILKRVLNLESEKKLKLFFRLAALFGIIPDFDLFYSWLINGTSHHHEYITHTPIFYLVISLLLFIFGIFRKSNNIKIISYLVLIGAISHLLLDSYIGGIMWLYPFSLRLYGMTSIDSVANSFFGTHSLFINVSTEFFIIALSIIFYIAIFHHKKKEVLFFQVVVPVFVSWIIVLAIISYVAGQTYQIGGNIAISDIDGDNIPSINDLDMDGDGVLNLYDSDASGNGLGTHKEMFQALPHMQNVHFTPVISLYEFTRRIGYFNNRDVVHASLAHAGIFMNKELITDFEVNPNGYIGKSSNSNFTFDANNYLTFFEQKDLVVSSGVFDTHFDFLPGDIVVFLNGTSPFDSVDTMAVVNNIENNSVVMMYMNDNFPGSFVTIDTLSELSNKPLDNYVYVVRLTFINDN